MARSVLLAPHNDDAELFAAYTCLRERPHVIVVLRSMRQAGMLEGRGPSFMEREAETDCAMAVLGCTWEQWPFTDDRDDQWAEVEEMMRGIDADTVWAPVPEDGGHEHHDAVGKLARRVFPEGVVRGYLTYRRGFGRSRWGTVVVPTPAEEEAKARALACYRSQLAPGLGCAPWFEDADQSEYVA
jgi:LmbE family N-acetylglucosaminyl deacetylase